MRSTILLALLVGIGVVTVFYKFGGDVARSTIQRKLEDAIQGQLDVQVRMGKIAFNVPYDVKVDSVQLLAKTPDGHEIILASFDQLNLKLARNPLDPGPLRVAHIDIQRPTLHVVRTTAGIVGLKQFLRPESQPLPDGRPAPKLSEVLTLRHLSMTDMRVQYDDRTDPTSPPMIWDKMNLNLDAQPHGEHEHDFKLNASTGDLAEISSTGSADLDALVLHLTDLTIHASLKPESPRSPLPPEVVAILRRFNVRGDVAVVIAGDYNLREPLTSTAKISVNVNNGQGTIPGWPDPVQDMSMGFSAAWEGDKVTVTLDRLSGRSGTLGVSLTSSTLHADLAKQTWFSDPLRFVIAYQPRPGSKGILNQPMLAAMFVQAGQISVHSPLWIHCNGSKLSLGDVLKDMDLYGNAEINDDALIIYSMGFSHGAGNIGFAGRVTRPELRLSGDWSVNRIELEPWAKLLGAEKPVRGLVSGSAVTASDRDLSTLAGAGRLVLTEGSLGDGVLKDASGRAEFAIYDRKIDVTRMSVVASNVQLRGQGQIYFNRTLDLSLYMTGGDVRQMIRSVGIPIVGNVLSEVFGGAQRIVTGAGAQLTQVRVTGTIEDPKLSPVAVPVLTDAVKKLFENTQ